MFDELLKGNMADLSARLYDLYGNNPDFRKMLSRLEKILEKASEERPVMLKKQDEEFLKEEKSGKSPWYLQNTAMGMTLYVDLFADNLKGLVEKIPYLKSLGINYIHLMPLFDCPKKENDGGYAISSYRTVQPRLGTFNDLRIASDEFRRNGIHMALDFVFNHTSDEHEWAKKCRAGDPKYSNFYYVLQDKNEVDSWNRTLREIFPEVRRGSFTFMPDMDKWVWTTFNSFQWDLNYSNPEVFLAMLEELFYIANSGIDVLRLDAPAFIWKEKGTCCESLPKTHTLVQAFSIAARIVAPSLAFKSEAIVHPDQVIQYIHKEECCLSYNPLQMALFWSSLASRDTRLLSYSLKKRMNVPEGCAWVNYIRCHDDIGWTFSDEDSGRMGIDGYGHRNFLNRFYTARFDGSFATGEPFQLNPTTGDCRICGTMASLAGLEQALARKNKLWLRMAVSRIKMMYAAMVALPGIPLIYAGDERAVMNDYDYKTDPSKAADSRWVHRVKTDWNRSTEDEAQTEIADFIRKLIEIRAEEKDFSGNQAYFYDIWDTRVFAFRRGYIHVACNFSENQAGFRCGSFSSEGIDLLTGKKINLAQTIMLEPYQALWIKEA